LSSIEVAPPLQREIANSIDIVTANKECAREIVEVPGEFFHGNEQKTMALVESGKAVRTER
jgi:hypothetical protein